MKPEPKASGFLTFVNDSWLEVKKVMSSERGPNMTLREIQDEIERKVMPCKCGKAYNVVQKAVMKFLKKTRKSQQPRSQRPTPHPL